MHKKKSLIIHGGVKTLGSRNSRQAADAVRHQRGTWSSNLKWPRMFLLCFHCVDPYPNDTRTHTPVLSLWPESFCFPVLNPERLDPSTSGRIVGIIERIESSMWPPYRRVLQLWRCKPCCQHPAASHSQIPVAKSSSGIRISAVLLPAKLLLKCLIYVVWSETGRPLVIVLVLHRDGMMMHPLKRVLRFYRKPQVEKFYAAVVFYSHVLCSYLMAQFLELRNRTPSQVSCFDECLKEGKKKSFSERLGSS